MAQKKAYSRYFIILQQDENGYSLSSDKLPSGYTKLETKNDKCKISYYVQNLKKEMEPYYMVLICSKKDVKKLIKLGQMNIDDHGRAEITYEYNASSIAESGIPVEVISGAAVVKYDDSSIISIMSGFATTDTPSDWRSFDIYDNARSIEVEAETKMEAESKNVEKETDTKADTVVLENKEKNMFDEYEEKIEEVKESLKGSEVIESQEPIVEEANLIREDSDVKEENVVLEKGDNTIQVVNEEDVVNESIELKEDVQADTEIKEDIQVESKVEDIEVKEELEIKEANTINQEQTNTNKNKFEDVYNDIRVEEKEHYPIGTVGEFFKILAEDFDEMQDVCKDIKKCKWYKVNVNNLDDMCNASNYNRYTIVYYPMINYYPYIKNHGHFLLGYKYDDSGKMKYLVYGIPGTRNANEQPYGGKSGFVTWASLDEGNARDNELGYWLMFYDFRTSTIVIPVK